MKATTAGQRHLTPNHAARRLTTMVCCQGMRTMSLCICILASAGLISIAQADPLHQATPPGDPNSVLAGLDAARSAGDLIKADQLGAAGLRRFPDHRGLWLAHIDTALARRNPTAALERCEQSEQVIGQQAELAWRRGQAYAAMGRWVGTTQKQRLPKAKLGQFVEGRLIVRKLDRRGHVLLSSEDSAIHATRLALEGGVNRTEVHLLYARCWMELGNSDVAAGIVRRQLSPLKTSDSAAQALAKAIAIEAGNIELLLDIASLASTGDARQRDQQLAAAHDQAADIAALRGDATLAYSLRLRAFELDNEDDQRRLRLADAAWDAGQVAEAKAHYQALLDKRPDHPARERIRSRLNP
jgi:tetratricopeptide (TPR) repeat protein